MKKLGIIQPGNIGDIVICLPIAKWYHDLGYTIIWPLYDFIFNNFKNLVDYVKFTAVPLHNCINTITATLNELECEILDLSFTSPYSWQNLNTKQYLNQNKYSFDEYKYHLARVPFKEKWNLQINRDREKEQALYYQLVVNRRYTVVQYASSDVTIDVKLDLEQYSGQIINLTPVTESVFDWLTILENAENLILIESCVTNIVDQLSIKNKKQILLSKPNYYRDFIDNNTRKRGFPILKNNWQII